MKEIYALDSTIYTFFWRFHQNFLVIEKMELNVNTTTRVNNNR